MKEQLIDWLGCINCQADLHLSEAHFARDEVESGKLTCVECDQSYPIVNFIPRFVAADDYTSSFGFQWNRFQRTQLDSHTGVPISRDRFFGESGWTPDELAGKRVLDVGCGAGRFAEVVLTCAANVVALDYSSAVDACWRNLGPHVNLNVVQGDIYQLPFKPGIFDFVYCFGVLQHTPDVERAFMALAAQIRGGRLAVDVYPKLLLNALWPKYWLRRLIRHMQAEDLLQLVLKLVKYLLPISIAIGRIPFVGRKLRYVIPVVNYDGILPLTGAQLREWSILDTYDMLSPEYDSPQSVQQLRAWFASAGMQEIEVFRAGLVVGRGAK